MQNPPIILGGIYVNSLGVVRDLAKAGKYSIVLHHNRFGIAGKSRYASEVICPDPWIDPSGLIEFLLELGKRLVGKGVLLVTDDKYLEVVSSASDELAPYYHCTFPDFEKLGKMLDKNRQYLEASQLKIPVPETRLFKTGISKANLRELRLPFLIKGLEGKEFARVVGKQVVKIQSFEDLEKFFQIGEKIPVIVQEEIPGPDENLVTFGSFINSSGEVIAEFTGRKLLQFPPRFGTCLIGESVEIPEIREYGKKLLKAFEFHGISQVEFKYDPRDHQYKLIEINGRYWKWHSLSAESGVNLSALAYKDIIGDPSLNAGDGIQTFEKRWIVWIELLRYLLFTQSDSLLEKIKNLRYVKFPLSSALFTWSDPYPFFFYLKYMLRKISQGKQLDPT